MEEKKKRVRKVVPKEAIYKLMLFLTYVVAGVFAIKNVILKDWSGLLAVSVVIVGFSAVLIIMQVTKTKEAAKQLVVSMGLIFVVFVISLYSGQSYSDDFILYLAVIGIAGMYLRPYYTQVQTVICDVLLVIQYIIHPEKGGTLGQFSLCIIVFTLAGVIMYMTITRGRSFIEISEQRAQEAEVLLESIRKMGKELEKNFESSSKLHRLLNNQLHLIRLRQALKQIHPRRQLHAILLHKPQLTPNTLFLQRHNPTPILLTILPITN